MCMDRLQVFSSVFSDSEIGGRIAIQRHSKELVVKHIRSLPLLVLLISLMPVAGHAQTPQWSGIIAPSRAIDWSKAGVPGGIPTRATICSSIAPYGSSGSPASPSAINSAVASCPTGEVVVLNAGTFYLNAPIDFAGVSNVTLRGSGADKTKIVIISSSNTCYPGFGGAVCVEPELNSFPSSSFNTNAADWTSGYSVGATSITLSSTKGLAVGMPLILDQCDDGFSGSAASGGASGCNTGSNADTGNVWNCVSPTANGGVCSSYSAGGATRINRAQEQQVLITNISGSTVTISPGLYMSNWRSGQSPGAFWPSNGGGSALYVTGDGVENLTFDMTQYTAAPSQSTAVLFNLAYGCWIIGTRIINTERNHVFIFQSSHITVANNYMYGTQNATSESYGVENWSGSDNLIVNNIGQHVVSPYLQGGPDEGVVWAYNYDTDEYYSTDSNWFMPGNYQHAAGSAMDLWEGNQGSGWIADAIHGTHNLATLFRNRYIGYQPSCYGVPCGQEVYAVQPTYVSRYFNVLGNVLGQSGVHTVYNDNPVTASSAGRTGAFAIYAVGWAGPNATYSSSVAPANDILSLTSFMRWGNYDTVNAAVEWNASEVPSTMSDTTGSPSIYANPVPSNQILPPSFYYPSQPSWWATPYGTPPWPANGPDVTGGSVPGTGGHANNIPAELCFANTPVDTSYQQSFAVAAATWSSGTVTLTAAMGSITEGEITVSGISPSGYNGTFQITASTLTSVSYALSLNPGSYASGGAVLYPNVRLFNGCSSTKLGSTPPQPPAGLTATVN